MLRVPHARETGDTTDTPRHRKVVTPIPGQAPARPGPRTTGRRTSTAPAIAHVERLYYNVSLTPPRPSGRLQRARTGV